MSKPLINIPSPVARAIRGKMVESGAAYVKLGQLMSCRPDIIGTDAASVFADLQKNVPAHNHRDMLEIAVSENPRLVNVEWEDPIACGSIGQVYRGKLETGTPVVVKVLRPGIYEETQEVLESVRRWIPTKEGKGAIDDYLDIMSMEVDLKREYRALKYYLRNAPSIRVPRPVNLTTNTIVMEEVPSSSLFESRSAALALCTELTRLFVSDGVLHTDLHPGNFGLCDTSERPVLYDYGSVVRVNKLAVKKIVFGILRSDLGILFDGVIEARMFKGDCIGPDVLRFCNNLTTFASQSSDLKDMVSSVSGSMPPTTNIGFGVFRSISTLDQLMRNFNITLEEMAPSIIQSQLFDPDWISLGAGYKSKYLNKALERL